MPRLRFVRQIFVLACLLTLTIATAAQEMPRLVSTVDYKPVLNGQISILVKVSADVQARLLLDTGWNRCSISAAIKDKLNIPTKPALDEDNKPIVMRGIPQFEATAPMIAAGVLQFNNFDFVVVSNEETKTQLNGEVDGIFGTDILYQCATLIDPVTKKVTFWYQGALTKKELKAVDMADANVVPIVVKDERLCVRARFNGKTEETAVLDIGSAQGNITPQLAKCLKLKPSAIKRTMITENGTGQMPLALLQSLTLGKVMLKNLPVTLSEANDKFSLPNMIGIDSLSHFRFIMDIPAMKLYLKPIPDNAKPDKPDAKP